MLNLSRIINETKLLYHSEEVGYVLASYSEAMESPEVMMFKATHEGQVKDWVEIFGEKFPVPKGSLSPSSTIQKVVNKYNNEIVLNKGFYNG